MYKDGLNLGVWHKKFILPKTYKQKEVGVEIWKPEISILVKTGHF
jgi:hypothetical protein